MPQLLAQQVLGPAGQDQILHREERTVLAGEQQGGAIWVGAEWARKANEMAMVGATYNKLEAFLKIVEQSQKDANQTKAPEGDKPAEAK